MIELREVTKTYGHGAHATRALDGIDLVVEAGEIAAVIGPSGAGKSTLAHCVNLLTQPTSGSVVVDGNELTGLPERQLRTARRAIGTIFQSSSLLSRRTVFDNVALPLEYLGVARGEREARVRGLLERVGLPGHADRLPHQLSGGQRQRVGIARALALRPSVLLSDEATSGLDPDTTRSILALLRELRDELGVTILLITHEMDVVREVADSAALLRDGRIAEAGRLVQLVTDTRSRLGHALLPERSHARPPAGEVAWQVSYGSDEVPFDWIERLGQGLGRPVSLLGAVVEEIGGRPVGRATIGVAAEPPERVAALLRDLGLHGTPGAIEVRA